MSDKKSTSYHYWEAKSEVASERMKRKFKKAYGIYWLGSPDQEWADKAKETYLRISRKYK